MTDDYEALADLSEKWKYRPVRRAEGWNPHVIKHLTIWGIFSLIFVPLCIIGLDWSMYLNPLDPTMNQVRYAVIFATSSILKLLGLSGFLVFLELITNGNLIGRAISTSLGAALWGGFLVIAAALILM